MDSLVDENALYLYRLTFPRCLEVQANDAAVFHAATAFGLAEVVCRRIGAASDPPLNPRCCPEPFHFSLEVPLREAERVVRDRRNVAVAPPDILFTALTHALFFPNGIAILPTRQAQGDLPHLPHFAGMGIVFGMGMGFLVFGIGLRIVFTPYGVPL